MGLDGIVSKKRDARYRRRPLRRVKNETAPELMGATLATLDVTAKLSDSADLDRRHHPPLFEAQMIRVARWRNLFHHRSGLHKRCSCSVAERDRAHPADRNLRLAIHQS
jgi:hypothetical protein